MPAEGANAYNPREYEQDMMAKQVASNHPMLGGSSLRNPPVRKVIEARIAEFEKQIAAHKAVLAAFDATPGIESVLDAMRKIGV